MTTAGLLMAVGVCGSVIDKAAEDSQNTHSRFMPAFFLAVLVPFSTHVAPNMVTMGSRETILPTSNPSECPSHSLDHPPQTTFIAAPQSLCRYIDVWSWRGGNFFCRRDDSDLRFGPFRSRLSDRLGWEQGLTAWGGALLAQWYAQW
jgi:hypothetical protein